MDLVYHDYEYDSDGTLHVGACDCRGGGGWLKLSYDKIASLEGVTRELHKLWALHTWRRERRYGVEYDITAPWPCYEVTYYGHDGEKVDVSGRSLGDFQRIVHEVCMSPKHVLVLLLKEKEGGGQGGRGEDVLGRLSLADHDSYMGMATWLHRLWGRHTGNDVAPGTWISRVADSWPDYRVRMMTRDNEEMDESMVDFPDCVLDLDGILIHRREN